MARGSRITVLEMTAGMRETVRNSAAMDVQELDWAGLEMTAGSRMTTGVCIAMDSRDQDREYIILS